MSFKVKTIVIALFAGATFMLTLPAIAGMDAAHSTNLGNTSMEGTETFRAFGDKEGLVKIMDDLMISLVADPRTKLFFDNDKQAFIKAMLVEQMCELMNGGCKYPGRDMGTAHENMKVNREAFNALLEQFQLAIYNHNVPFSAQNKLRAKLAPMYHQIETTDGTAVSSTKLSGE